MFVAAVSGAGLAALHHEVDGFMYVFLPLVLVVCVLLGKNPTGTGAPRTATEAQHVPLLTGAARGLIRPFLVTFSGFGAFIQVFGYLRGL
jgi:hypothetical protein